MEPNQYDELELTSMLYAEVAQKLAALEKTLIAQGIMSHGHSHIPSENSLTMEQLVLLAERVWLEKAHKSLADARAAIAEAEEYEHQRIASSVR
jgi:hypothetical protein